MFYVASKILWIIVQPLSIIALLVLLGIVLAAMRWRRTAVVVHLAVVLILAVLGYTTLGALLIQPLENRFPRPAELPANVSAIVVLGGASVGTVSQARGVAELNMAADRMTEALVLARTYPNASIIFSGGIGSLTDAGETEAETAHRFFLAQGIAPERLLLESEARNTAENASFLKTLLAEQSGATLLVTSAFHMPRSVGLFRAEGISVIPWPTDYRSTGNEIFRLDPDDAVDNFALATTAIREWIGLVAYAASGRIADLFPAP